MQKKLIFNNLRNKKIVITDSEVEFFRKYPEELDKMTNTLDIKRIYLKIAAGVGFVMVALSILIKYNRIIPDGLLHGFLTDLLFEGGVALWGASITVYLLEILLSNQTKINEAYRSAVLHRIKEKKKS